MYNLVLNLFFYSNAFSLDTEGMKNSEDLEKAALDALKEVSFSRILSTCYLYDKSYLHNKGPTHQDA